MFRKDLIDLLLDNPKTITQIARENQVKIKEVANDLEHIRRSLRHSDYMFEVTPAECRKCGFQFGTEKLTKPSRCPRCRATWLREPRVQVRRK